MQISNLKRSEFAYLDRLDTSSEKGFFSWLEIRFSNLATLLEVQLERFGAIVHEIRAKIAGGFRVGRTKVPIPRLGDYRNCK